MVAYMIWQKRKISKLLNIEAKVEWENLPTKLHPDYEAMKVIYD